MAVPKRKQTPSRTGMKEQKYEILKQNVIEDKKTVNIDYHII